jgi:hypothetical protein
MCMAVGNNANTGKGFGQLWNGSEWGMLPLETWNRELKGVSCASPTACMIIEKNSNGTWEMKWYETQGGIWYPESRVPPTPAGATEVSLQGVSCSSASACTAVGSYRLGETYKTLALRWNGTSWSQQATSNPSEGNAREAMLGVSCPSATFCVAVGKAGSKPFAERWNGSEWLLSSVPKPAVAAEAKLEGVSCVSSSSCIAVGSFRESTGGAKTLAENWNGTSWSRPSTPNPEGKTSSELSAVSCLSPRACTAVGQSFNEITGENKTLVEALTGTAWAIQASPNPNAWSLFSAVSCTSSIACTAVGSTQFGFSASETLTLGERYE